MIYFSIYENNELGILTQVHRIKVGTYTVNISSSVKLKIDPSGSDAQNCITYNLTTHYFHQLLSNCALERGREYICITNITYFTK